MPFKVFVFEDHQDTLELIGFVLAHAGFSVGHAETAAQGLKRLETSSPDLIILNMLLPDMEGFSLCAELRRSARTASVPILMVTGWRAGRMTIVGAGEEADDYIANPFSPGELLWRAQMLLGIEAPVPRLDQEALALA